VTKPQPKAPTERKAEILRRLIAADIAQTDLLTYTGFTMPDPRHMDDVRRSRYQRARVHQVIADAMHKLERRDILRLIINCPPRHGKTELASKRFMAWHSGLHPEQNLIFGTYNETYAADIGRSVRDTIQGLPHLQVFPDYELKDGSASSTRLETKEDGLLMFVGRGGSITGRGGHGIILDDPIKGRKEADSPTIRDDLWKWYQQDVKSRLMTDDSFILLVQTRWHEDDLVGRLTDPTNPYYDEAEAREWTIIDLPALAGENDALGRKKGEALWPERFNRKFLLGQKRGDPRGFQALYQGRPTAETGAFFDVSYLKTYKPNELPSDLRIYCASDHAVSTAQDRDRTCLLPVGVDEMDNIYILPDAWWRRADTEKSVDAMVEMIRSRRPIFWWSERGQISKSIGPFLRKRMNEEQVYASVIEMTPTADKMTRAQSILGRMAMGKVYFPEFAPWWPDARDEILKFPHGAHDDFVDALAYIGLGLAQQVGATTRRPQSRHAPGTFGAMLNETRRRNANPADSGW